MMSHSCSGSNRRPPLIFGENCPTTDLGKMRKFPEELLLRRIKGTLPAGSRYKWARAKSIEECFACLRKLSDQDFGTDVVAWENWWLAEKKRLDIDPEF